MILNQPAAHPVSGDDPARLDVCAAASAFAEYYRCPAALARLDAAGDLSQRQGYFTFGGSLCYGRRAGGDPSLELTDVLEDVSTHIARGAEGVALPFDLSEIVGNLRHERYRVNGYPLLERVTSNEVVRQLYYLVRPALQVGARKHLQKIRLRGWERIPFPRWPVDTTVESLMERAMAALLSSGHGRRIPFIWFWPDGARACAMMTHDVEGEKGYNFVSAVMDLDDSFGIKSAFQLIPQGRERAWRQLASALRARGFEVNLHDLNHDGHLFHSRSTFLERAQQINRYAREFECHGFRSGAMYREQQWYGAFEFSYDMSVPNVAHLEPQRGGCCTVMPYFIGDIVELPLTTLQDYSLFHILDDYSVSIWQQQTAAILERNGLMTFLTHPDYLTDSAARTVYTALLAHLRQMRDHANVWVALPGDVDRWWRNRRDMTLVRQGDSWRIEGPDAHLARLAYASLDDGRVRYTLSDDE